VHLERKREREREKERKKKSKLRLYFPDIFRIVNIPIKLKDIKIQMPQ